MRISKVIRGWNIVMYSTFLLLHCFTVCAEEDLQKLPETELVIEQQRLFDLLVSAEQSNAPQKIVVALEELYGFYTKYDFLAEAESIGSILIETYKDSDLSLHGLARFYMRYSAVLIYRGKLVNAQHTLNEGILLSTTAGEEVQSDLFFNKAFLYGKLGEYGLAKHFYLLAYNKISPIEKSSELLSKCEYGSDILPIETAKILVQLGMIASQEGSGSLDPVKIQKCALLVLSQSQDYYSIVAKAELAKTFWLRNEANLAVEKAKLVLEDTNTRNPQLIDMLTLMLNAEINSASLIEKQIAVGLLQTDFTSNSTNLIVNYVTQLANIFSFERGFYSLDIDTKDNFPHPIKLMAIYNALVRLHLSLNDNITAEKLFKKAQALSNMYIHRGTDSVAWKSARSDLVDTYLARYLGDTISNYNADHNGLVSLIAEVYDRPPRLDSKFYLQRSNFLNKELNAIYKEWIKFERSMFNRPSNSDEGYSHLALKRDAFFTKFNNEEADVRHSRPKRTLQNTGEVPSDTIIYRYVITKNKSFVLVMTHLETKVFSIPERAKIDHIVKSYNDTIVKSVSPSEKLKSELDSIFPQLPLQNSAIQKIVVIADGSLHYFPFAAMKLRFEESKNNFLISRFYLTHSYSITDYLVIDKQEMHNKELSISIFADPTIVDDSNKFSRLTETANEANAIKQTFPLANIRVATQNAANTAFLMSEASRQSTILHIATHGYFNPDNPEIVGLITAPSSLNTKDGFLSLNELLGYPVSSQLVVIAGCETSLGKNYNSVGVKSMSRGFIAQGAETVLATLWPVQDRATAEFMKIFYQNLATSKNSSIALQKTQKSFARHGRYRHPKYWAGFVLTVSNQQYENINLN